MDYSQVLVCWGFRVVLGWWGGGGPWLGGSGGLSLVSVGCCYSLRGGVPRPRGSTSPWCGRVFLLGFIHFDVGCF